MAQLDTRLVQTLHVSDAAHYRRMVRSAHAGCLQRQTVALFIGTQRRSP